MNKAPTSGPDGAGSITGVNRGAWALALVAAGAGAAAVFGLDPTAAGPRGWMPWAGLCVVAAYYAVMLGLAGRPPAKGAVMPSFAPPAGVSPPAARYLWRGAHDQRTTAAALVDMAVAGQVALERENDGLWLEVTGDGEGLPVAEKRMLAALGGPGARVPVNSRPGGAMQRAGRELERGLYDEYAGAYLRAFRGPLVGGLALTVGAALANSLGSEQWFIGLGLFAWLAVWAAGCLFLAHRVWGYWRAAASAFGGRAALLKALALTVFAAPFLAVAVLVFNLAAEEAGARPLVFNCALLLLAPLFILAVRRPTAAGRRLVEAIEGFRLYLEKVEMPRAALNPGPLGTAGRELAFGVALNLEHDWSLRLEEALSDRGD